ncbi:MAG: hypothetical protein HZB53_12555 [Chloroflexi bacterium]|nr:hypothetical protein [Chloroflexota bacterium]
MGLRFLQIHSLPLWVDSVHHAAIARLILAQGGLPESYRPFAEADQVYYHLGYHVAVAVLARLSGFSVEQTMLWFGQALNALACFTLYPLAAAWTGRRSAALLAVVVPGTLSLMPAYYVTWGRYTQLAALVLLPLAMLAYQRAAEQGRRIDLLAAAIAAGLLFWVHYRVTFFFATFVAAYLLLHSLTAGDMRKAVALLRRTAAVAAGALLLAAPWLWRLWTTILQPLDTLAVRFAGNDDYNAVPFDLFERPGMTWLIVAAGVGALIALWRGGRFRRYSALVLLWVAITAVALNPGVFGARPTWIVNNFSAAIALYVPEALLIALGLAALADAVPRMRTGRAETVMQAAVVVLALVTAPAMIDIVNPVTVLAEQSDVDAMAWIRHNTPPDAVFAVNERRWQGQTYMGSDGGYWITNLTGRRTTMPIVFYTQGTPEYVARVNTLARQIEAGPDPDDPPWLAALRDWGVTHVYIGVKGGALPLDRFEASPHYRQVYAAGGVHIFTVQP